MAGGFLPSTARGAYQMAGHFGVPIHPSSLQPFLDLEKDRQRMMMSRMVAGPAAGAAAHLAPVVPEATHGITGAGTLPLTQALPQMAGMADPAIGAAGGAAGNLAAGAFAHWAPILAMGTLGAGAGILGAYGAGKLVNHLLKRRRERKARRAATDLGVPKLGSILERSRTEEGSGTQGAEMFRDLRFVKFAAEGALGYRTPENFKEAIEKVAFTAGFLTGVGSDHELNQDESLVFNNLTTATKTASELTRKLANRLRVKRASADYDHSLKAIAKECYSGLKKTASAPNRDEGLGDVMFDNGNKMAAAIETLGVDETTLRALVGGKQTAGYAAGILGLVA